MQWQPPAAEIAVDEVDEVDETAHDDPQSLRIAPGRARAVADRLDVGADFGEVVATAADPTLREPPGAAQGRCGGAAEQHRRVRLLHGKRAQVMLVAIALWVPRPPQPCSSVAGGACTEGRFEQVEDGGVQAGVGPGFPVAPWVVGQVLAEHAEMQGG